jgi:hypothetical protein
MAFVISIQCIPFTNNFVQSFHRKHCVPTTRQRRGEREKERKKEQHQMYVFVWKCRRYCWWQRMILFCDWNVFGINFDFSLSGNKSENEMWQTQSNPLARCTNVAIFPCYHNHIWIWGGIFHYWKLCTYMTDCDRNAALSDCSGGASFDRIRMGRIILNNIFGPNTQKGRKNWVECFFWPKMAEFTSERFSW